MAIYIRRTQYFILLVSVVLLTGIASPEILFGDAKNIPEKTIARAKDSAYQYIFDNPIEPWLIMRLVVSDRQQEIVSVDAYTFFGLRYATVTIVHNAQTGALVCAGRTYDIWQKDSANSTLPCG